MESQAKKENMDRPLLSVKGLTTVFHTARGDAVAVDGVDFALRRGETVAVVGESGCGKTMLALSILGLVPDPPGRIESGEVLFKGADLLRLPEKQMRAVRGDRISMIFQEPMTSLNPVFTVGEQIAETLRLHRGATREEARATAAELFALVGIPNAGERLASYPHEFSGGMRQRVVIAMALACDPDLILADEPTTALDVTIQAQILHLLISLQREKGMTVLLITHDLGVVAQTCDHVLVMYTGKIVESADTASLFREPLHPYAEGLMRSLPRADRAGARLTPVSGAVPDLLGLPSGCAFHPRCPKVMERCRRESPPLFPMGAGRAVRCWLYR